ncbi:MAG TPA: ferric reductase-like transmembrane domain-containing protein [Devosia sp.]|jgi:predicted ferric reductase|nr:ferric reductase-like transmembrane domain-containing protein [Devosia sp.]
MKQRAAAWIVAAFVVLALPFAVLLAGERVQGRNLLWDFCMGLGFGALALGGLQFALTARFRPLTNPFGADIVYLFHRYLAIGAVGIMLAHFGILYVWFQSELGELNPLEARWELTAGRVALLAFGLLVITSEFRKWLKLEYELWRLVHLGLAVIGFAAAIAHVLGVGRLTAAIETRSLWLGVTLAWLLLLVWLRIGKPWLQRRNPWRVVSNVEQRGGAHSLVFEPLGKPLKPWKPGQFIWLTFADSPYQLEEHPFTISSAPEEGPNVTISVKPLGDFSKQVVKAAPGDIGYLEGPFGVFTTEREEVRGFVMIAGGIGITPMLANLKAMQARGDKRNTILFYANSDLESAAFREDLAELERGLNLKVVHVLEQAPPGANFEEGYVTAEILQRHLPETVDGYKFLLCGPPAMTEAVRSCIVEMGVPESDVDSEVFDMV